MLLLTSTVDEVRLVTASAGLIEVHASFVDNQSGVVTPVRENTTISTAATTVIVPSPITAVQRNVRTIYIKNEDASSNFLTFGL